MAVAAAERVFGMVLTTLAVAVAVVSLALAVHYRIRCRRAERAFEAVIGRLDRHDEALARAPAAYVSWDRSGEDEYHSGGLPRILGLHPTTAVSWEMLRGRRDPADGVMIEADRKSVVSGQRVSVRVDLGGRRIIKKKKNKKKNM